MEKIKTTLKEKLSYAFGNMGSYVLWAFSNAYVTIYVTECIKPDNELVNLLGTIFLVCRFFDGVSDIIMGLIIEKTHSKLGKARFWFGISIIPLTILFFLLFSVSGVDQVTAIILITIIYFLFTVVFYTMSNVAFNAMLPRITNDSYDQSNVCTINSIFTSVGSLASAIAVPILNALGGEDKQLSWTIFVGALALIAIIGQVLCFIKVKEKPEIVVEAKEATSKDDLKRGLKTLFKTKYFYLAVLMFMINFYISLSVTSIGKYYAQYVLGNENYFSLFGSVPMATMAVGLVLTPLMVKKLNKKRTLVMAIGFVALGNIIGAIFPYSFAASFTGVMIKGFGSAVVMSQLFTLAPDIVKYVEAKEGVRVEGLAASANSFGSKIGSGFGLAVVLWSLSLCGYVAGEATQVSSAIYTFIALYWWIPALLSLVLLLLASLWDIEKKTKEIIEKNEKKSIEVEEINI